MKKIFAALLALVMAASLCACGSNQVNLKILDTEYAVEDYAIAIAKENDQLLSDVDAALNELIADGTLQKIVDKYISGVDHGLTFGNDGANGTLTMGTNAEFPPYEYYDGENIVGIDAEVAAAIADKLGKTLVIEDMAFDSIIVAIQTGKIDMGMAGMTVTDERKEASISPPPTPPAFRLSSCVKAPKSPVLTICLQTAQTTTSAFRPAPPVICTPPGIWRTKARRPFSATTRAPTPCRRWFPARWTV
jgi:membrane-bound lytic murein transglycosylase MltF